jgi:hypothetical protein
MVDRPRIWLSGYRGGGWYNFSELPMSQSHQGDKTMRTHFISVATATLALATVFCTTLPALAITPELAKKCRAMAIKAHPPSPAGTNPYAQAERQYYNECISKNGAMPSDDSATKPAPKSN